MKKTLIVTLITIGVYFGVKNFPHGTYNYKWSDSSISIKITDNYLVVRDPECTKYITINDRDETLKLNYWAETYPLKIYKRKNEVESFWVIDDFYRGISRSKNGEFQNFICPGCTGIETTYGDNIVVFQFENDKLIKLESQ